MSHISKRKQMEMWIKLKDTSPLIRTQSDFNNSGMPLTEFNS